MIDFSANTTRTELECFCELHAKHAKVKRFRNNFLRICFGLALVFWSARTFLDFLNMGPDGLLVLAAAEAIASYILIRPVVHHALPTDLERKTEECLNSLSQ